MSTFQRSAGYRLGAINYYINKIVDGEKKVTENCCFIIMLLYNCGQSVVLRNKL